MSNLTVPVLRTYTVGEYETGAFFNSNIRDSGNFLLNVPICNAVQATPQALGTTGVWFSLNLDSTVVDSYGGHSNSTNNSRYTAQAAGWCLVSAAACFATNSTGFRGVRVAHNGTPVVGSATDVGANSSNITTIGSPTVIVYLAVGDYVEGQGLQSSGGSLNTSVNTDANCGLTVVWLHA